LSRYPRISDDVSGEPCSILGFDCRGEPVELRLFGDETFPVDRFEPL
jgi:hypothetical protein